jgi:hypothetical protein
MASRLFVVLGAILADRWIRVKWGLEWNAASESKWALGRATDAVGEFVIHIVWSVYWARRRLVE